MILHGMNLTRGTGWHEMLAGHDLPLNVRLLCVYEVAAQAGRDIGIHDDTL